MSCDRFNDRLDGLLAGTLPADERAWAVGGTPRAVPGAGSCTLLLGEASARKPVDVPGDLTDAVLSRTSGPPCERARACLGDLLDDTLDPVDRQLVEAHLRHCDGCAALAAAAARLRDELPALAELPPPPPELAEAVLARTRGRIARRPSAAGRWRDAVRGLFARPRIAWEAGCVAALLFWLMFGASWSPLRATAVEARVLLEQGVSVARDAGVDSVASVNRAIAAASARIVRAAHDVSGRRGAVRRPLVPPRRGGGAGPRPALAAARPGARRPRPVRRRARAAVADAGRRRDAGRAAFPFLFHPGRGRRFASGRKERTMNGSPEHPDAPAASSTPPAAPAAAVPTTPSPAPSAAPPAAPADSSAGGFGSCGSDRGRAGAPRARRSGTRRSGARLAAFASGRPSRSPEHAGRGAPFAPQVAVPRGPAVADAGDWPGLRRLLQARLHPHRRVRDHHRPSGIPVVQRPEPGPGSISGIFFIYTIVDAAGAPPCTTWPSTACGASICRT